ALDIKIDSADRRGFRITRLESFIKPELAAKYNPNSAVDTNVVKDTAAIARMRRGDYAIRSTEDLGVRYLRVEVFPQAKSPEEQIPKTGSRVIIGGDIRWDGDGHIELHPRRFSDIHIVPGQGQFLDIDDPLHIE